MSSSVKCCGALQRVECPFNNEDEEKTWKHFFKLADFEKGKRVAGLKVILRRLGGHLLLKNS